MSKKLSVTGFIQFENKAKLDKALDKLVHALGDKHVQSRDDNKENDSSEYFFVQESTSIPINDSLLTDGALTLHIPMMVIGDINTTDNDIKTLVCDELLPLANRGSVFFYNRDGISIVMAETSGETIEQNDVTRDMFSRYDETYSAQSSHLYKDWLSGDDERKSDIKDDLLYEFDEAIYVYVLDGLLARGLNLVPAQDNKTKWERLMDDNLSMPEYVARYETGESTADDLLRLAGDAIENGALEQAANMISIALGEKMESKDDVNKALDRAAEYSGIGEQASSFKTTILHYLEDQYDAGRPSY